MHFDPDNEHGRIDLKAVAKTEDGQNISFGYVGVITMNEGLRKIFTMDPEMKTVPFGNASKFALSVLICALPRESRTEI